MDKLVVRYMAVILLGSGCSMVCPQYSNIEHRSVGVYSPQEDIGKVALFVLYVIVSEYGKVLDKQAICPVYCEVQHKHIYETKESNIQTDDRILRSDESKDREQSESNI